MKRIPENKELTTAALTTLAIVNLWALIIFLYNFPGLIKQLTTTEVLSVLGYVLFSALVESLVVVLFLTALSALLPPKLLLTDFSVRSGILLVLGTIYMIPFHTYIPRITTLILEPTVTIFIAAWTVLFIVELVLFHLIVQRYPNFKAKAVSIFDRITVLGAIYLILDLIGFGYVIVANWS